MYFNTHNDYECSGCFACYSVCTHKAITMVENGEGFLVPRRNMDLCVHCGLCEKVCPVEHPVYENSETPDVFAAYSARERRRSSSGGMFYAIARYVIGKGGVVFGAAYDKDLRVRHIAAADMAGLEQLRGSKYVQSHVGDAFKEAAARLKQGRLVYFTGTPCQIAGLKSFLRRRYDNLLTSDLVCHGVPSQWLFDKHLQYLSWREGSKVTSYSFRDGKYWTIREKVDYADGKVSCEFDGNRSPYLYAFGLGYTYRRSCFDCKFARIPRQGDITLADYWGVGRFHPQMDDRGGVSLLLVNSAKGREVWNKLVTEGVKNRSDVFQNRSDIFRGKSGTVRNARDIKYMPSTLQKCSTYNSNVVRPTREPEARTGFFARLAAEGYDAMATGELNCPASMRNGGVVLRARLRRLGLWQPIDWLRVVLKRVLYASGLHERIYNYMSGKK